MHIYFEDWSHHADSIEEDLPHEGRVIKVWAHEADPREIMQNESLGVVVTSGTPFTEEEIFDYPGRRAYSGQEIEEEMTRLKICDEGLVCVRALLRFSYTQGFSRGAMAVQRGDTWLIDHPIQEVDRLWAAQRPQAANTVHLDIFFPESIRQLRTIIDIDNPQTMLSFIDGMAFRRKARQMNVR